MDQESNKRCRNCKVQLTLKNQRDYDREKRNHYCISCASKKDKEYYIKNKDRIKANRLRRYRNNKEKENEKCREHYKSNKAQYITRVLKRRVNIGLATLKGHEKTIKQIYNDCPQGYEVDHIIPIKGKGVCGLHVPWNLQYLTKYENRSKSNKI